MPFRISRVAGGALIDGEALQVPQRPFAVAVSSHFLYVADALHNVIRRIDVLTGKESTAVGSGTARSISDGALPLSVGLYGPSGVATDQYGDLLISDSGNRRVLVVPGRNRRLFGMQMIGGRVYQLTGRGVGNGVTIENPWGITVDEQGDAIFVDSQTGTIWLTAAESGRVFGHTVLAGRSYPLSLTTNLSFPRAVAATPAGLAIADTGHNRILFLASQNGTAFGHKMRAGVTYTLVDSATSSLLRSFNSPQGVVPGPGQSLIFSDGSGDIYILTVHAGTYYGRYLPSGVSQLISRGGGVVPGLIGGLSVDARSDLFIAGQAANAVAFLPQSTTTFDGRSIAAGVMVRVAGNGSVNFGGDGGLASMSDLSTPIGLAGLSDGGVVIADTDNNRVRMIPGTTLHAYGRTLEAHHIYTILGDGSIGPTIAGSLGTRTSIGEPVAVAVDALNDIFALSRLSNQLFVIPANGESFLGRPVQAGHVYLVAGDGSSGFSGDGGKATLARFSNVASVAVDSHGIAIADSRNGRIRYVALQSGVQFGTTRISGDVYTIAGDGSQPSAVVSGILGTRAFLGDPQGVAFDSRGDLVVADTGDNVIRLLIDKNVRLSGHAARADFLYTLAGNSEFGYSRDGLPGLRSSFALPTAVTVDGHGNILVADSSNNRIRVLAMSNGAFYGLSMKQGDVYTVAGSGSIGSFGSSIPTKADLTQPSGVASASSGAAWISNTEANEVCVLEPDSRTPSST